MVRRSQFDLSEVAREDVLRLARDIFPHASLSLEVFLDPESTDAPRPVLRIALPDAETPSAALDRRAHLRAELKRILPLDLASGLSLDVRIGN